MKLLRRWPRSRLRAIMRGARRLRAAGEGDFVEQCQSAVLQAGSKGWFPTPGPYLGRSLSQETARKALSQYISIRIGLGLLPRAVLAANGAINSGRKALVMPLPKVILAQISALGQPVSEARCRLLWALYISAIWSYGLLTIWKSLISVLDRRTVFPENATYFSQITPNNFPVPDPPGARPSYDLLSWMRRYRLGSDSVLLHSVPNAPESEGVFFVLDALPPLKGFRTWTRFLAWSVWAPWAAIGYAIFGQWQRALLLHEAARAAHVRVLAARTLPTEYAFSNSNLPFRPLWSYEAEARGSRVVLYFYSTNSQGFQFAPSALAPRSDYQILTWPKFLIWDVHQEHFLRRAIHPEIKCDLVGPIWFSDSGAPLPEISRPCIAYFDVQPIRSSSYDALGLAYDYYLPKIASAALRDVVTTSNSLGAPVLYKRKRNIGRSLHPVFASFLKRLEQQPGLNAVDPPLAAQHVIEKADAVVSMPWTSTALIAREMKKPSCYYDPTGRLLPNDPGAHGIEVVQSPDALRDWLERTLKARKPQALQELG